MNQIPSHGTPGVTRPLSPSRRPPTSRLAIVGIVLAAVPCCPAVSLVGSILGMAALRRIQAANGSLGGRRLALWAVGIGFAVTFVSTMLMIILVRQLDIANRAIITTQIAEVVNAATDDQIDRAAKSWNNAANQTPTNTEFDQFGNEVSSRYGRLQRFTISSMATGGTFFEQQIEVAGVYIFQNAERPGSAVFDVQAKTNDLWPQFRLRTLMIEDRERGDLKLPSGNTSP
jgi:hypothetical protein